MLDDLSQPERLDLVRFVCSFAWADLRIKDVEREYVARLVRRLKFTDSELAKVDEWLKLPPLPEEVDPAIIPPPASGDLPRRGQGPGRGRPRHQRRRARERAIARGAVARGAARRLSFIAERTPGGGARA